MKANAFALVPMLLFAGTACVDPVGVAPAPPDGWSENLVPEDPAVRALAVTQHAGIAEAAALVAEDEDAWRAIWEQWVSPLSPTPEPPEVDFDSERVVVAAMGGRHTGGYAIGVDAVTQTADETVIEVFTVSPGHGCVVTQALTAPAVAVAIPASGKAVRFTTMDYVHECE